MNNREIHQACKTLALCIMGLQITVCQTQQPQHKQQSTVVKQGDCFASQQLAVVEN